MSLSGYETTLVGFRSHGRLLSSLKTNASELQNYLCNKICAVVLGRLRSPRCPPCDSQKSGTSLEVVIASVETSLQHLRALGRALNKVLRPHEFFFLNVIPLLCVRDIVSETETAKRGAELWVCELP
jgi:hypothetical protein